MNEIKTDYSISENKKPSAEALMYDVCVSTHPGCVRSFNEDSFVVNNVFRIPSRPKANVNGEAFPQPLVCGVFDGMGGETNGDLASELCAKRSVGIYDELTQNTATPDEAVFRFVTDSNRSVVEMLDSSGSSRGGSTFVLAVLLDGLVYPYSLGDSRLYLYSGGVLRQINTDHTLAMKKYFANVYTLEEAVNSPDSHKLTFFLGVDINNAGLVPAVYEPFVLGKDEKLLLCSDGLYDMLSLAEIGAILDKDSNTVSYELVKAALERGGVDNITCVVIRHSDHKEA